MLRGYLDQHRRAVNVLQHKPTLCLSPWWATIYCLHFCSVLAEIALLKIPRNIECNELVFCLHSGIWSALFWRDFFYTGSKWDGGSGQKMEELQSSSHRGAETPVMMRSVIFTGPEEKKKKEIPAFTTPVLSDRGENKDYFYCPKEDIMFWWDKKKRSANILIN